MLSKALRSVYNQRVKKALKTALMSKLVIRLLLGIRTILLLRIIKKLPKSKIKSLLSTFFDPNNLRKKIHFRPQERLMTLHLQTPRGGESYVVNINDHIGHRLFIDGTFDETILKIAEIISIHEEDILLDIGANIGAVSIPVALKTGCEVIAIEASPMNSSILLKNISLNKVKFRTHNVCALNQYLMQNSDYVKIYNNCGNFGANSIYQNWNRSRAGGQDFEFSKTVLMDSLLSEADLKRIKLIKIDVEGAELAVLQGFSKISEINAPIIFEYRIDVMKRDLGDDGIELVKELNKNYVLFGIRETENSRLFLTPFEQDTPAADAIGFPKKSFERYAKLFTYKESFRTHT
jgi:FkbM family methyltransferase